MTIQTMSARCTVTLPSAAPTTHGKRAARAVWESTVHDLHTPGEYTAEVFVLAADSEILDKFEADSAPDWIPRPPDGWDLGVRIHAERRLIEAEHAEAVAA